FPPANSRERSNRLNRLNRRIMNRKLAPPVNGRPTTVTAVSSVYGAEKARKSPTFPLGDVKLGRTVLGRVWLAMAGLLFPLSDSLLSGFRIDCFERFLGNLRNTFVPFIEASLTRYNRRPPTPM